MSKVIFSDDFFNNFKITCNSNKSSDHSLSKTVQSRSTQGAKHSKFGLATPSRSTPTKPVSSWLPISVPKSSLTTRLWMYSRPLSRKLRRRFVASLTVSSFKNSIAYLNNSSEKHRSRRNLPQRVDKANYRDSSAHALQQQDVPY